MNPNNPIFRVESDLIQKIEKAINESSREYRDADFKDNPSGYTVAPWVNSETTVDAFEAGCALILPLLKKALECVDDWACAGNIEGSAILRDNIESEMLKLLGSEK